MARDEGWKVLRGRTVGLVTNPTGVMPSTMEHAVDVMHASVGGGGGMRVPKPRVEPELWKAPPRPAFWRPPRCRSLILFEVPFVDSITSYRTSLEQ